MQDMDLEFEKYLKTISTLTSLDEDSLRGDLSNKEFSEGWASSARKEIHEDYWGDTILKNVRQLLSRSDLKFDEFWEVINTDEFFYGSGAGRRLLSHGPKWSPLQKLTSKNRSYSIDELKFVPSIKVLFCGHVHLLSPFVSNRFMRDEILNLIAPLLNEDSVIIDLGSGWGRYSTLFASRFKSAKVFSGEISSSGRETTRFISSHYDLGISSFEFDYQSWGGLLKILEENANKRVVIFSNHSIEQVTYLQKAFFEQILETCKDLKFLHIEPVGWQADQSNSTLKYSTPPQAKLGKLAGYNKNLIWLLRELQLEGKIADLKIDVNYVARHNVDNSGTKITYAKSR